MREWVGQRLESRWVPWIAAALGVVLTLPSLGMGLIADDYLQWAVLQGSNVVPTFGGPWMGLFNFVPGTEEGNRAVLDAGVMEWTAHESLRLAFWRPLTAATHVLDHALWPDGLRWQHAHSLGWYAVAVLAVAAAYRRTIPVLAAAGLAAVLFAVQDYHATAACWLANRNALISVALGAAAVALHVRWRRGGGVAEAVAAPACLGASLLAGESGLGLAAYVMAYQLVGDEGRISRRMLGLLPAAAVVVGWFAVWKVLGFGIIGSGIYVDPSQDPLGYLAAVAERGPLLLAALSARLPCDAWIAVPMFARPWMAAGAAAVALCAAWPFFGTLRARREARFWALGAGLTLLPLCANFPMDRVLLTPGIGAVALLAIHVERMGWLGTEPDDAPARGWRRGLVAAATVGLLVLHGPLSALLLPGRVLLFGQAMGDSTSVCAEGLPDDEALPGQTVFFVNGFVLNTSFLVPTIRQHQGRPVPRRCALLSSQITGSTITRPDERTLVFEPDGGYLRYLADRLMRDPDLPFAVGDRVALPDVEAEVTAVTADGRPATVAFHFVAPLEDPSLRFFALSPEGLVPFALPPVGGEARIERTAPPGWEPLFDLLAPLHHEDDHRVAAP